METEARGGERESEVTRWDFKGRCPLRWSLKEVWDCSYWPKQSRLEEGASVSGTCVITKLFTCIFRGETMQGPLGL